MREGRRHVRLSVAGKDVVEVAQRLKRLTAACTHAGVDEACYGSSTATQVAFVELFLAEGAPAHEAASAAAESLLRGHESDDFLLPSGTRVRLTCSSTASGTAAHSSYPPGA